MTDGAAAPERDVIICECFARDGLQHEGQFIETPRKIELIDRFGAVGFERIEATSFSHPKRVPQFADAEKVLQGIRRRAGSRYKATCANLRSVERAVYALENGFGPEEISVLISATDSHNKRNLNRTRDEQWKLIEEMAAAARGKFMLVGAISMVLGCVFEGMVDPKVVAADVRRFASLGVNLITLGDTAGLGTPVSVAALIAELRATQPASTLVAHFHNTRGTALANCVAALHAGVRYFDSSFGGIGGHPANIEYGEGNTGNVPTEDLVVLFESMRVRTGLDLPRVMETAHHCESVLNRELLGMVTRTSFNGTAATTNDRN